MAVAFDFYLQGPLFELLNNFQRLIQFRLDANDADQVLHALLQVGMNRVRILVALGFKGRQHGLRELFDLVAIYTQRSAQALGIFRGIETGAPAEYQQVGERVAAQAIGAMETGGDFAGGE